MEALVQETERKLYFIAESASGRFVPIFEKTFDDEKWTVVLWDVGSGEVLFDSGEFDRLACIIPS